MNLHPPPVGLGIPNTNKQFYFCYTFNLTQLSDLQSGNCCLTALHSTELLPHVLGTEMYFYRSINQNLLYTRKFEPENSLSHIRNILHNYKAKADQWDSDRQHLTVHN